MQNDKSYLFNKKSLVTCETFAYIFIKKLSLRKVIM